MKRITFTIVALLLMAGTAAAAGIYSKSLFSNYTGSASTARYSTTFNYGTYTKKTVVVGGMHAAAVYAPYSGTFVLQGSNSASGPWVTVKDKAGNAVSATGNAVFDIDSMMPYLRGVWTRTKHRVNAFIYFSE